MVQHIAFRCQHLELEGLWTPASPEDAAIITHPHPMDGGDMHNAVVETISEAYRNNGWSTLRFNFRGTGNSKGHFDNGNGEQADLAAAIAFLQGQGIRDIELAGYSFGAWVLACHARKAVDTPVPMRFVAPPVAFLDFSPCDPIPQLQQVLVGASDEFAPLDACKSHTARWNPQAAFDVVAGADHFFWHQMERLRKRLETRIFKKKLKWRAKSADQ